jgi:hypothetical protein
MKKKDFYWYATPNILKIELYNVSLLQKFIWVLILFMIVNELIKKLKDYQNMF